MVRGSTYAAKVSTGPGNGNKTKTLRRGRGAALGTKRSSTPPPVPGRSHMDIQTDEVLEELTDKPIEMDMETQTPAIHDRPPSPLFVRAKIGHDTETQIMAGDLFNFDVEGDPILEVLVARHYMWPCWRSCRRGIECYCRTAAGIRNCEEHRVVRGSTPGGRDQAKGTGEGKESGPGVQEEGARRELEEKVAARSFCAISR